MGSYQTEQVKFHARPVAARVVAAPVAAAVAEAAAAVLCGDSGCGGGCGGCAPATTTVCRRVWVPNIVTEQIPVTTYQNQKSTQEYTYTVTLCRTETRNRPVTVHQVPH